MAPLRKGYPLYYGDAESHLDTARQNRRLPHAGLRPDRQSLAAAAACSDAAVRRQHGHVANRAGRHDSGSRLLRSGGDASCSASRGCVLGSSAAGLAAALLFGLNPNMLYLQSTPMSEPVYLAHDCGRRISSRVRGNAGGGGAVFVLRLTDPLRGWALIPVVALVFLFARGTDRRCRLRCDRLDSSALLAGAQLVVLRKRA